VRERHVGGKRDGKRKSERVRPLTEVHAHRQTQTEIKKQTQTASERDIGGHTGVDLS